MAETPKDIHVSNYFRVSRAPVGTPLPTDVLVPADGPTPEATNLNAAFVQLGYTTPDGSLFRVSQTNEGVQVHQAAGFVRLLQTETIQQIQTVFREYNQATWLTAFNGGEFTSLGGGITRYDPPAFGHVEEASYVLDSIDGDQSFRLVIPRATVSSGTETAFQRTAASDLPVTIDALIPGGSTSNFYILTNATGLASS